MKLRTLNKTLRLLLLLIASARLAAADKDDAKTTADHETIFREPFTLKLHVDKEHFYEQSFGKIPYVQDSDVYLFKGDEFGLDLNIKDNSIHGVSYQSDLKKADVTFKLTQEVQPDGSAMMLLVIQNRAKQTLNVDALMTVPNGKGIAKTTIVPIQAGLADYESWPHPIVQLVLRNFRFAK